MRVRVRYSKLGKIRFISAIDMGRIWERALRRADLPIAYSEGFSPHPKVSFPDALTLGYASTGEYAELTFAGRFALDRARVALSSALPAGMDILAAVEVPDGAPRLSKWLAASMWDLDYRFSPPTRAEEALRIAGSALMAAAGATVDRDRKGEITAVDLRPALVSLHTGVAEARAGMARVRAVLHHTEPPMRAQELHQALAARLPAAAPASLSDPPALVTRVVQGRATDDGVIEAISGEFISAAPPTRQKATT